MDKSAILAAVQTALQQELASLRANAELALDEATSEESRAEGKYDTRSLEAGYLAGGLAARILDLERVIAYQALLKPQDFGPDDPIAVGALVVLEDADTERQQRVFLAPRGGLSIVVDGVSITVLSPSAPLGQALTEALEGDCVELDSPRGLRTFEILQVR